MWKKEEDDDSELEEEDASGAASDRKGEDAKIPVKPEREGCS